MFQVDDSLGFLLNHFHVKYKISKAIRLCFNCCCDGLDFIFRSNESELLEHSVLLGDSLGDFLCGLNAEFLLMG